MIEMKLLQAFREAKSNVGDDVGLVNAWMSCLYDIKQHRICNLVPDFECIGPFKVLDP